VTDTVRSFEAPQVHHAPSLALCDSSEIGIGKWVGGGASAIEHTAAGSTTGIVSQIRPNYEWSGGKDDPKHRATVIQTQTPINPGNSGGPLLQDDGQLIGVNSFGVTNSQGLNFAVSARDVREFLAAPVAQNVPEDECKSRVLFEGRSKDNDAFIRNISLKCDDRADIVIVIPDDKNKPVMALVDVNRRNKVEGIVLDERRQENGTRPFGTQSRMKPFLFEGFILMGH
jgi:Trypsin-like peptidase domain